MAKRKHKRKSRKSKRRACPKRCRSKRGSCKVKVVPTSAKAAVAVALWGVAGYMLGKQSGAFS